jgi:hypothetical protein
VWARDKDRWTVSKSRGTGVGETGYELDSGPLRHFGVILPSSTILAGPMDFRCGQARRCVARPDHEIEHCAVT